MFCRVHSREAAPSGCPSRASHRTPLREHDSDDEHIEWHKEYSPVQGYLLRDAKQHDEGMRTYRRGKKKASDASLEANESITKT